MDDKKNLSRAVTMECLICLQTTDKMYKVNCRSSVPHEMCFGCEEDWRAQAPVGEDGMRKMTCPHCRQKEGDRSAESLTRELVRLNRQDPVATCVDRIIAQFTVIYGVDMANTMRSTLMTMASTPNDRPVVRASVRASAPRTRPPIVPCASGRDCRSRSVLTTRTKTHMKCRQCNLVACCRNCKTCLSC